jgi:hypothetical protein
VTLTGDVERALAVFTAGLRHPGAPAIERARAHLHAAELAARLGDMPRALTALDSARASDLSEIEEAEIRGDFVQTEEIVNSVRDAPTQ